MIWLLIVIILLFIFLLLPVKISIKYKNKTKDKLIVKVSLLKDLINFHVYSKKNNNRKEREKKNTNIKNELLRYIFLEKENILLYLNKTKVLTFQWTSIIGFNDAALTAIVTGVLWTLKYNLLAFLFKDNYVSNPLIHVTPKFNNYEIKTEITCIFETKLVHIINIGLRFLIYKRRRWYFDWAPNWRFNEDNNG